MSGNDENKSIDTAANKELVVRSDVPKGLAYNDYLQYLRPDFFFSCAYCTMAESEAMAIRFTIDHYESRRARPELLNEYGNLMYSCNQCNVLKGSRVPTDEQRAKGYRYFRPDEDVYGDHFRKNDLRVEYKTPVGYYTLYALDLNRKQLRKLRELRKRLTDCDEYVVNGIKALRKFQLDQLPAHFKGPAAQAIGEAYRMGRKIGESIDSLLKANAHSPLIDEDEEAKIRAKERADKLKQIEGLRAGMLKGIKA
jgi:hypothetical protein